MTYDAADGYVLMFGGAGAVLYNETWVFQNDSWREIFPAVSPLPTGGGEMVYDAHDGYVVLFGGQVNGAVVSNQTWEFLGGNWTQLFPSVSPPARQLAGLTYDAVDGFVLLFGGNDNENISYSDTWSFAGGSWTNRTSSVGTGPSPRSTSMTYDATDGYVLLFGGAPTVGAAFGDTWKFDRGNWSVVNPTSSPYARWPAPMAYDAADGYVLLFGSIGVQGANGYQNDTWEYRGGAWSEVFGAYTPSGRWVSAMTYDPAIRAVVLYGGYLQPNDLGDTWTFSAGNWTAWEPAAGATPPARSDPAMAFDAADGYVLLFGGQGASGLLNDTWSYAGGTWTPLSLGHSPTPRSGSAMVYDSTDHYLLLFGGSGASGPLNDSWRFSNGSWQVIPPAGGVSPPARANASIADDARDGYVVLYGGLAGGDLPDTWSYAAGAWHRLTPSSAPSARSGAAMAYDPVTGRVILFGGMMSTSTSPPNFSQFSETWAFTNGHWSLLNVSGAPSPRDGAGLAYLPTARALILYGGNIGPPGSPGTDTWAFNGTNWTNLFPSVDPGPASYFGFGWEATSGAIALFGSSVPGAGLPITWQFSYGTSNNSSGYPAAPLRVTTSVLRASGGPPELVVLTAVITGGTLPYTLQWIFGDGTQGSARPDAAVSHTYPGAGRFTAVLIVQDGSGQRAQTSTPIQVAPPAGPGSPNGPLGGEVAGLLAVLGAALVGGAVATTYLYHRYRLRELERREGETLVRELRKSQEGAPGPP
ncbi:MAG: PKD domain-containing protein [Thermoplasmata archaeon]|nr:PKD domain-containing protein [Thermoplasmata archaeon]